MIKIPESKYIYSQNSLIEEHYEIVKDYIIDSIMFYINCCDYVQIKSTSISAGLSVYQDNSTLKSLVSVISKFEFKKINNIEDALNNCRDEFKNNIRIIRGILYELIKNTSGQLAIKYIVKSKPEHLIILHNKFKKCIKHIKSNEGRSILNNIIKKIFNYEKFIGNGFKINSTPKKKWTAYSYCEKLNVRVCPYCNRSYTFTVRKTEEDIIRPELDHYFPQCKYPLFSLSFYNLIPSCKICNSSIKGQKELYLKDNLHPYLEQLDTKYKFKYQPINYSLYTGDKESIKIKILTKRDKMKKNKSINNLKFFKIEDIYKEHRDIVAKLILLAIKYNLSRLEEIKEIFNKNNATSIERIVYITDLLNDIFHSIPGEEIIDTSLGKFRNDIIEEIKKDIYGFI